MARRSAPPEADRDVDEAPPARAGRRTLLEKFLTAVTAVLTVATAVFGLLTAMATHEKEQAQDSEQATSQDLTALEVDHATLVKEADKLRSENDTLRERLGLTVQEREDSGDSDFTVRNSGTVTVALGTGIDLDSELSDDQWRSNNVDLGLGSGGSYQLGGQEGEFRLMGKGPVEAEECVKATGFRKATAVSASELNIGDFVCIVTDESHISVVRVAAERVGEVDFDIVTYNPSIDRPRGTS